MADLERLLTVLELKDVSRCGLMWKDTITNESKNECIFEVIEQLECVLDNKGIIIDSRVTGTVYATCDVSGGAEASIILNITHPLTDYSLHRDIISNKNEEQFKERNVLRFYPTGGTIELLKYVIEDLAIELPFKISYNFLVKSVTNIKYSRALWISQ